MFVIVDVAGDHDESRRECLGTFAEIVGQHHLIRTHVMA